MSHFARADDSPVTTTQQLQVFNRMTQGLPGPFSVCNSAASLTAGLWTTVSSDEEQWVRPGICLYGSSPFEDRLPDALGLRPAMTLDRKSTRCTTVTNAHIVCRLLLVKQNIIFFFNEKATTEIYTNGNTLSLHDALPI